VLDIQVQQRMLKQLMPGRDSPATNAETLMLPSKKLDLIDQGWFLSYKSPSYNNVAIILIATTNWHLKLSTILTKCTTNTDIVNIITKIWHEILSLRSN